MQKKKGTKRESKKSQKNKKPKQTNSTQKKSKPESQNGARKGSARNPGGGTLWGALSVCCVCRVYVYIIIIYRALGFVGGVLALGACVGLCALGFGCLCGYFGLWVLGFCFVLIVLIVIT